MFFNGLPPGFGRTEGGGERDGIDGFTAESVRPARVRWFVDKPGRHI